MISFILDGIEYRTYDHLYAVSKCGKVLRKMTPSIPAKHPCGYLTFGRMRLMHRMVAICWIPNPNNYRLVHHIDGDKTNNHADNLEWVTPQQHIRDRHHGMNGKYFRTDETRQKMRDLRLGTKDSGATRAKKAAILAEVCPKSTCKFQGVTYPSVSAGARAAGILPTTFRVRCLSKNFPEYELLSTYYG